MLIAANPWQSEIFAERGGLPQRRSRSFERDVVVAGGSLRCAERALDRIKLHGASRSHSRGEKGCSDRFSAVAFISRCTEDPRCSARQGADLRDHSRPETSHFVNPKRQPSTGTFLTAFSSFSIYLSPFFGFSAVLFRSVRPRPV